MKLAFAKGPTRAYSDFSPNANPFILVTDFLSKCCAATLSQLQNGQERLSLVLLARIMLLKQVTRRKRELLAVIVALKNSNVYYKSVNLFCALTLLAWITWRPWNNIKGSLQDDNCSLVYFLISRSYTCHVNADVLIRRADIIDVTPELSTDELIVELTTTTIHPPLMKENDRQNSSRFDISRQYIKCSIRAPERR